MLLKSMIRNPLNDNSGWSFKSFTSTIAKSTAATKSMFSRAGLSKTLYTSSTTTNAADAASTLGQTFPLASTNGGAKLLNALSAVRVAGSAYELQSDIVDLYQTYQTYANPETDPVLQQIKTMHQDAAGLLNEIKQIDLDIATCESNGSQQKSDHLQMVRGELETRAKNLIEFTETLANRIKEGQNQLQTQLITDSFTTSGSALDLSANIASLIRVGIFLKLSLASSTLMTALSVKSGLDHHASSQTNLAKLESSQALQQNADPKLQTLGKILEQTHLRAANRETQKANSKFTQAGAWAAVGIGSGLLLSGVGTIAGSALMAAGGIGLAMQSVNDFRARFSNTVNDMRTEHRPLEAALGDDLLRSFETDEHAIIQLGEEIGINGDSLAEASKSIGLKNAIQSLNLTAITDVDAIAIEKDQASKEARTTEIFRKTVIDVRDTIVEASEGLPNRGVQHFNTLLSKSSDSVEQIDRCISEEIGDSYRVIPHTGSESSVTIERHNLLNLKKSIGQNTPPPVTQKLFAEHRAMQHWEDTITDLLDQELDTEKLKAMSTDEAEQFDAAKAVLVTHQEAEDLSRIDSLTVLGKPVNYQASDESTGTSKSDFIQATMIPHLRASLPELNTQEQNQLINRMLSGSCQTFAEAAYRECTDRMQIDYPNALQHDHERASTITIERHGDTLVQTRTTPYRVINMENPEEPNALVTADNVQTFDLQTQTLTSEDYFFDLN